MTPHDLYQKLLSDYPTTEHILCDLHKPCIPKEHRCDVVLTHRLINFDQVKDEYIRNTKQQNKSSVDGYTYKEALHCFVELKGWKKFLEFHTNSVTLESIKKQANKYDLNKKLIDSIQICTDISKDNDLFHSNAVAFVLVTDIAIQNDGIVGFWSNLGHLAETSAQWEHICNEELRNRLSSLPSNVSTYYVNCQEFETLLSKL